MKDLASYKDIIPFGVTAIALYTDGRNLTISSDGISESGHWKLADKRVFSKVLIYKKTQSGGDIFIGDFKEKIHNEGIDKCTVVQFTGAKLVGRTKSLWTEFTGQLKGSAARVYLPRQDLFWIDPSEEKNYPEGTAVPVMVNKYERSKSAREKCIKHFGAQCQICDMKFDERYGSSLGVDFIHVHHIVPLYSIGKEYAVDPIKDLLPVCPNCHAMLHRGSPNINPSELREIVKKHRTHSSKISGDA